MRSRRRLRFFRQIDTGVAKEPAGAAPSRRRRAGEKSSCTFCKVLLTVISPAAAALFQHERADRHRRPDSRQRAVNRDRDVQFVDRLFQADGAQRRERLFRYRRCFAVLARPPWRA